ncbi:MAG: hypothetical protein ACOWWM_07515 [Desulfobacterales bacterium]
MTKSVKSISDLQKKVLEIRRLTERTHADKAAAEEELGKLNFTLSLYQGERDLDEQTLFKIEKMKERVAELEAFVNDVPAIIRDLERKRAQLGRPGA